MPLLKRYFPALLLALTSLLPPATALAQTVPPVPAAAPANLEGPELRVWLRQNWYTGLRQVLDYGTARGRMYNYIDNFDNKVVCVYSGYTEAVPPSTSSTSTGVVRDINCEHSIPQSWFNENPEQRTDIHHLYPTRIIWNSDRGADPFADIPDNQTLGWLRNTTRLTTIPTSNIDEYSEDTNSQFEPREDHKGNLARTAFYFYTMHTNAAQFDAGKNVITALADLATLYRWHLADPVDERERERNRRTAAYQGNFNPYINDPTLVARAWNLTPAGPVVSFSAATASVMEGAAGASTTYTATLSVSPAPTAALTVQVALDAASSTASSGTDFTFTSPQTVSFAAGQTTAPVSVSIVGDAQAEADETIVLTLQNPSTGAAVGGVISQTITITNDDGTPPTVRFALASGSILEGNAGTQTSTVSVEFGGTLPAGGFTVPVSVEASSTANSSDYTLSASSLSFSGAATQQILTVTVNGDALPESNETLRLRLGAPSNGTVLVGTPATHVLTISNDDEAPNGGLCSTLYFSEYVESGPGAGNVKVLEIYNPTPAAVDLDGFRVELYEPGATAARFMQKLSGVLAAGAVYVVANSGVTDAGVKAKAQLESDVNFFSGGHVLALFDGTDTLDIIGRVGKTPPGGTTPAWTLPDGGSTRDNTLVRRPAVGRGSTRWLSADGAASWQAGGVGTYGGLGSYSSTACRTGTATRPAARPLGTLELFPNPAAETVQVRLPGAAGSTAAPATLELLDNLGRVVRTRVVVLSNGAATLDLRGLPAGLYAVRVHTAAGPHTGRVVLR